MTLCSFLQCQHRICLPAVFLAKKISLYFSNYSCKRELPQEQVRVPLPKPYFPQGLFSGSISPLLRSRRALARLSGRRLPRSLLPTTSNYFIQLRSSHCAVAYQIVLLLFRHFSLVRRVETLDILHRHSNGCESLKIFFSALPPMMGSRHSAMSQSDKAYISVAGED